MPVTFLQQSITSRPDTIGSVYSADVINRYNQRILLVREYVSAFTHAKIVTDETANTLRSGLIIACSEMFCRHGPETTIRVDPASAFRSLVGDAVLKSNNIRLELGREKYINKNPVAERAISELHSEMNRVNEDGGTITPATLALAVANLNSRIRSGGLSAFEVYTQRDQFTGDQIPMQDMEIIKQKEEERLKAHRSSEVFKSRGKSIPHYPAIRPGDIVYINSDRLKIKPRDRYIVVSVDITTCKVQKFSGSQLRARPYTVNRADILAVHPWKFDTVDSDTSGSSDEADYSLLPHVDEEPRVQDPDGPLVNPAPVGVHNEGQRHSGRRTRKPAYLSDYVCGDTS